MGFIDSVFGEEWKVVKETDEKVILSNGRKIVPVSITGGVLNYNTRLYRLPRKATEKVQRIIDLRNTRIV
jgi:hypothetical protein